MRNIQSPNGFDAIGEYFLYTMELEKMKKDDSEIFETYRELICHFYICMDVHNARGNANGMKIWVDYLFPILDDARKKFNSRYQMPMPTGR